MENIIEVYSRKSLFSGEQAAMMVNRIEVNGEIGLHGHDFFEIALAADGVGGHVSALGEQTLSAGDVVIIRPGAWHGYTRCNGLLIYNCCFNHQLLQRELGWMREDVYLNFLLWTGPYVGDRKGVSVVRLLDDRLAGCLKYWESLDAVQGSTRRTETLGRLLIFLDHLAQAVKELEILKQQARPFHPAVMETMHLLESQIERGWSLRDLAAQSHLNPSYLDRLFKAEIGLAPIAYLNRCRVERAAGLLLHTTLPVADVAAQVGWYDPNLFSRRFRVANGMSPSEYRKRFGKDEA